MSSGATSEGSHLRLCLQLSKPVGPLLVYSLLSRSHGGYIECLKDQPSLAAAQFGICEFPVAFRFSVTKLLQGSRACGVVAVHPLKTELLLAPSTSALAHLCLGGGNTLLQDDAWFHTVAPRT